MSNSDKLVAYSINNMYLSGIHAGIQTAHAHVELAATYCKAKSPAGNIYSSWLEKYKVIIVLNGGCQANLERILHDLKCLENEYPETIPWAYFRESKEALGGALTNVVFVAPSTGMLRSLVFPDAIREFVQSSISNLPLMSS